MRNDRRSPDRWVFLGLICSFKTESCQTWLWLVLSKNWPHIHYWEKSCKHFKSSKQIRRELKYFHIKSMNRSKIILIFIQWETFIQAELLQPKMSYSAVYEYQTNESGKHAAQNVVFNEPQRQWCGNPIQSCKWEITINLYFLLIPSIFGCRLSILIVVAIARVA